MDLNFQDDLLYSYSERDLISLILDSPRLAHSIALLSPNYVAKSYRPDTVEDMVESVQVARQLGVPAPCIKRVIQSKGDAYCIMDRIMGSTLEEAWMKLGWFTSIKLAFQLRRLINRLRSLTSSTAGSLATGECQSFYLEDLFLLPPRSSPGDITSFIKFWAGFVSMRQAMKAGSRVSVNSE